MKIRKGDAAEAVDAAVVPGDGLPVDDPLLLDVDVELRQRVPITAIIDIPYAFARDRGVVMLPHDDGSLTVALREGADPAVLIEVRRHLAQSFDIAFVDQASFERHLQDRYAIDQSAAGLAGEIGTGEELDALASGIPSAEDLLDSADDAPAIRLINGIIAEAVRQGVSDIHIEPYESGLIVRMRIDGVLKESLRMPA
ncbi:MAG: type II secretion system protein GspE, partial [Sphingomonadales bacterium]|nr:type II secretion system protein GspE [Sphingomonadales bacterium]